MAQDLPRRVREEAVAISRAGTAASWRPLMRCICITSSLTWWTSRAIRPSAIPPKTEPETKAARSSCRSGKSATAVANALDERPKRILLLHRFAQISPTFCKSLGAVSIVNSRGSRSSVSSSHSSGVETSRIRVRARGVGAGDRFSHDVLEVVDVNRRGAARFYGALDRRLLRMLSRRLWSRRSARRESPLRSECSAEAAGRCASPSSPMS